MMYYSISRYPREGYASVTIWEFDNSISYPKVPMAYVPNIEERITDSISRGLSLDDTRKEVERPIWG